MSKLDQFVNQYDERLHFRQNEDTGDWCIYLSTPPSEPDLPILGWQELPAPDDVMMRLWKSDTLRHGEEILQEMNERNAARSAEIRAKADEGIEAGAEVLEWINRKAGNTGYNKVFFEDRGE